MAKETMTMTTDAAEVIRENENLKKQLTEAQEKIKLLESKAAPRPMELPRAKAGAVVIVAEDPYFDGALRAYNKLGLTAAADKAAPPAARGLVLNPDDPRTIPVLQNYLVRLGNSNPGRRKEIEAALNKLKGKS